MYWRDNMAKKSNPQDKLIELIENIKDRSNRWQELYNNGGSDPFWSDGINLNLVRNHIIYYKRQIFELCEENIFLIPEEYDQPTPEKVSKAFMAKPDKIMNDAKQAYSLYQSDIFTDLFNIIDKIDSQLKRTALNIIGCKHTCRKAIQEYDFVTMRRYCPQRARKDIEAAKTLLEKIKAIPAKEPAIQQTSLF